MFCNKHVSSPLPETRLSDYRMKINVISQIKNEIYYENRAFNIFKIFQKVTVKKKRETLISSTLTHNSQQQLMCNQ